MILVDLDDLAAGAVGNLAQFTLLIRLDFGSDGLSRFGGFHLDAIAPAVSAGAHAILLCDRAGWHTAKALKVPSNISLMPLLARSPELNPQENIWQFMRQNWLSNRVFKSYDNIVDYCCYPWNALIDQPW
jgi:DDE superfamily endonuclease